MKPGIKTTEFWLSSFSAAIAPVLGILVGMGIIGPDVQDAGVQLIEALTAFVGVVAPMFVARNYNASRTQVKVASNGSA